MRKKILFCGGRSFTNVGLIEKTLRQLSGKEIIVHGECTGVDKLVDMVARRMNRDTQNPTNFWLCSCPADWRPPVNPAEGPIRNAEMLEMFTPDLVIAFSGGRGTMNMINNARIRGIETRKVGW